MSSSSMAHFEVSTRRRCEAASGTPWSASSTWPGALGGRRCVLDHVIGDAVAVFDQEVRVEHFEEGGEGGIAEEDHPPLHEK
mgnify:CR=1 FL=1